MDFYEDNLNQSEQPCGNAGENIALKNQAEKKKSEKSNSELMAEFFNVNTDTDKKE